MRARLAGRIVEGDIRSRYHADALRAPEGIDAEHGIALPPRGDTILLTSRDRIGGYGVALRA